MLLFLVLMRTRLAFSKIHFASQLWGEKSWKKAGTAVMNTHFSHTKIAGLLLKKFIKLNVLNDETIVSK